MKNRVFSACALIAAFLAYVATAFAADEVHFTITGPDSVTFDWRGANNQDNKISYGTCSGCVANTVTATAPSPAPISSSGPFFEAKLAGLSYNTVYYYKIGSNPEKSFKMPPAPGGSGFVVVAEGDIGTSNLFSRMPIVQSMIAGFKPDLALLVGDLTYANPYGQTEVDRHFNDVMVWSQSAAYMPAWGNHEWDAASDDMRNYLSRFAFPNANTSPTESSFAPSCPQNLGEDWYWFDYGNTRFIAYPEPFGACGVYADNPTDWNDWFNRVQPVMQDAQNNANLKFIVTFGHRPAYSSGYHPGDTTLRNYLDYLGDHFAKYVLNINGHSHNYERSSAQHGVTHLTVGTGGGDLEAKSGACLWSSCPPPSWSAARFMRLGVTKLAFGPTGISGQFICGPAGGGKNDVSCGQGDVIDTFTIGVYSPAPTAALSAQPTAITGGQSSTLTWSSTNATSCAGTGFNTNNAVSGNVTVTPAATTTYSVNCTGPGGAAQASATVSVTPAFTYTLADGGPKSVLVGGSVSQSVVATLTGGAAQSVAFSVSGLPSGAALALPSCAPTCTSTGTITTTAATPPASYTVTVTGAPNNVQDIFLLTVNPDTTPPTTPGGLAGVAVSSTRIDLSWTASTDPDNASSQIVYNIYRNGSKIGATGAGVLTFSDTGLTAATTYNYTIGAVDPAGNPSALTSAIAVKTLADPNATIVTSFSGPSSTSTYPPHNALCVGPNHAVMIEGSQIQWTNLTGGSPVTTGVYSFFASLNPTKGLYDQRCAFDTVNKRFVVIMEYGAGAPDSAIYFAVSKDANPNDGWLFASFNTLLTINGQTSASDRPSLAVDGTNVYLTAAQYTTASPVAYLGTEVWVIDAAALYASGALNVVANELLPASQGQYYVAADGAGKAYLAANWPSGGQMVLGLQSYDAASKTFGATSAIALGSIDQGVANVAQQQGTAILIDAGDKRVASLAYSNKVLWGASTMTPPGSSAPLVHWFQVDVTNPGAPVLLGQGDVSGAAIGSNVATFNPSVAADAGGDVIVNFAVSSPSMFPANYYAVRRAADSGFGPAAPYQTSGGFYNDGSASPQRWGLYSSALADPNNAASFWISNEYASASHWWQTSVAQVAIPGGTRPTATLTANPTSIASGQTSTLTWSSTNATSCTGAGFSTGGATNGTASVTPAATTTYTMTCSGAGGTSNLASATVTVTAAAQPTATLTANPTSIASGQTSTLTWSSTNATSCTGAGFSTGGATNGTASVTPAATTTYTMTCSGAGGTSNPATATVTVTTGGVTKRFDFNASSSGPTATGYTAVQLVAYSAALGYGWQSIAAMDSRNRTDVASLVGSLRQDFHKSTGASGSYDSSFLVDLPNGAYSVTVYLGDGDMALTNQYVDAQGTKVVGPISTTDCATNVASCSQSFTFPVTVTTGQLNLRFYTTNAASVYYGYAAVEGVDIVSSSGGSPTATLTASPTSIASGQTSTLTWSSTNATSCTGAGFSTGGATTGTASVTPAATTTYTMTCSGAGGTSNPATATVTVTTGGVTKRFDFNASSSGPTATGYTAVQLVAYSAALGYGWQSIAAMDSRNRTDVASLVGSLRQDFHKSTGASGSYDSSFLVDLPNGAYSVTVYLGDGDMALTNQYVDAQGTKVVGPISTTDCATNVASCSQSFTFPVTVTTGQLNLRFYTTNAASVYYGYAAVEGVDIVSSGP
ncbi:metallophosphoesterase [Methylocystis sp. JAN1]|uniref:metallophosphoesterase n=1 Tax=Methylocystis sp. JAN1 TaxID=3397211 RepID=UPI003FA33D6B